MDDVCTVNGLEGAKSLVDKILGSEEPLEYWKNGGPGRLAYLAMIVRKVLGPDNSVQIGLHEFLDDCSGRPMSKKQGQRRDNTHSRSL